MRISDHLARTAEESDIAAKSQEDQLAPTVMEIWIALFKMGQEFHPYPQQTEGGIHEMERAYWSGIWYQHMGDDRNVAEAFPLVWLNGRESLQGKEAIIILRIRTIALRKPEKYMSPAIRKYLTGNVIHLKYFVVRC